jgi:hypothetical protein
MEPSHTNPFYIGSTHHHSLTGHANRGKFSSSYANEGHKHKVRPLFNYKTALSYPHYFNPNTNVTLMAIDEVPATDGNTSRRNLAAADDTDGLPDDLKRAYPRWGFYWHTGERFVVRAPEDYGLGWSLHSILRQFNSIQLRGLIHTKWIL